MKTEQEIITKIIEIAQDIQYLRDKIDRAQLDEDTTENECMLDSRKKELDTLNWLFS